MTPIGQRVRTIRMFRHWRQTPGEVVDFDGFFATALVRFDNGVERWLSAHILEPVPTKETPR